MCVCSGGHLNPAVTLGVLVSGGVNIVAALCYFIAQLVGGIVGAACVMVSLASLLVCFFSVCVSFSNVQTCMFIH